MRNEHHVGLITYEWRVFGQTNNPLRHYLDCAVQGLGLVLRVLEVEGEVQVNALLREAGE